MDIKIFLDDIRNPPDGTWVVKRNAKDFIASFIMAEEYVESISLDHDLGENVDGYDVVKAIVALKLNTKEIHIHSANIVGRENMRCYLQSAIDNGILNKDTKIIMKPLKEIYGSGFEGKEDTFYCE
jgi:hypothetical protein